MIDAIHEVAPKNKPRGVTSSRDEAHKTILPWLGKTIF